MKCFPVMVIHDQEQKTREMESANGALQCEPVNPEKGNACHLAVLRLQPLQPLPMVNLEETEKQDYRPQLDKINKLDLMNPDSCIFPCIEEC